MASVVDDSVQDRSGYGKGEATAEAVQLARHTKGLSQTNMESVIDILDGAVVEVLDPRLPSIHVEPNAGEENDSNIPRNLHNAAELFLKTGNVSAAQQMQRCALVFFALVEGRCKSETTVTGRACICWLCGHCGLERQAPNAPVAPAQGARACNQCGESLQTNYVQVVLADGVIIPWKEISGSSTSVLEVKGDAEISAPTNEESLAKTREAKRAAIAASVEAAREAQQRAAETATTKASAREAEGALKDLDPRLMSMRITPNEGEDAHPNFPTNLYNAMELFAQLGRFSAAQQMHECTDKFLRILDEGPQAAGRTGQGHVCFECGHCGLEPEFKQPNEKASQKACFCGSCGDDSHTNFVELVLPNGRQLPWMERTASAAQARPGSGAGAHVVAGNSRIKPNDPCPCGSGQKAKKCCHVGGA